MVERQQTDKENRQMCTLQLLNIKEIVDRKKQKKDYLSWLYTSTLNRPNHLKH